MSSAPRSKASVSQSQHSSGAAKQPTWEKLYQRGLVVAAKQQLAHEEMTNQSNGELEECTFHPHINQTSRTIAVKNFSNSEDLFAKLFEDAAELRRRREEKAAERRRRENAAALAERNKLRELNLANQRNIGGGTDAPGGSDESPVFDRLARKARSTNSTSHAQAVNACTFQPNTAALRSASQQRRIDALCSAARRRKQLEEDAKERERLAAKEQAQSRPGSRTASQEVGSRRGSGRGPSPSDRQQRPSQGTSSVVGSVPRHARATESFANMKRDAPLHADPALMLPPDEPLTLQQLLQHNLRNAARSDLPQPSRPDWYLP
jgi:hypothetical protein